MGFSPSKGRTYLKDKEGRALFSSFDGKTLDLTNDVPNDIKASLSVFGGSREDIGSVPWHSTSYFGEQIIYSESK